MIRDALANAGKVALTTVGVRLYEQPRYVVRRRLGHGVELRGYAARVAAVTTGNDPGAFDRLFRYIEGANGDGTRIAMTVPVVQNGPPSAPSGDGAADMRFFLPQAIAARGAPPPSDPRVRIVEAPAEQIATLRLGGIPSRSRVAARGRTLLGVLRSAGLEPVGFPTLLVYDPPWTLPFLRRSEVAVRVGSGATTGSAAVARAASRKEFAS